MKKKGISKIEMAKRMHTSRSQLDRAEAVHVPQRGGNAAVTEPAR